jgi:hypothetical protein
MIELVPLARADATLAPPLVLPNTPAGMRIIFEIHDYRFEGERLRARQKGVAAADWLVVGPDGTATLDVRATLETHDGALVLLRYGGRVDASRGLGGRAHLRCAAVRHRRRALRVAQPPPGDRQGHARRQQPRVRGLRGPAARVSGARAARACRGSYRASRGA